MATRKPSRYQTIGCPRCHVPPGVRCIKVDGVRYNPGVNYATAEKVPYHSARIIAYSRLHGREFKPEVMPTPPMAVTQMGNMVLSGTDRLNQLLGRSP